MRNSHIENPENSTFNENSSQKESNLPAKDDDIFKVLENLTSVQNEKLLRCLKFS